MILLLLMLCVEPNPFKLIRSVSLDTNGQALFGVTSEKITLGLDGSCVIATDHTVWHFNRDGSLRLKFGRKGEGPVEFQYITTLAWDGTYYWVVDGMRLETSQIDGRGKLVRRHFIYFEDLTYEEGLMLVTHGHSIKQLAREQPKMLFRVNPRDGLKQVGKSFHTLSIEAVNVFYNYTHHFITVSSGCIYVIDQVRPSIYVYNKDSLSLEREIKAALPGFLPSPKSFFLPVSQLGKPINPKKFTQWEDSWCRISGFSKLKNGFILTYERPDKNEDRTNILARVNMAGKATGYMKIKGRLVGVNRDRIMVFIDWDDEKSDSPEYQINVYQ